MIEKFIKEDQSLQYFVVIVVLTEIQKADVSRDHKENNNINHEKDHSTDICEITKTYRIDKLILTT